MPKWWTDTVWTKCQWLFYCNLWIAKELCMCTRGGPSKCHKRPSDASSRLLAAVPLNGARFKKEKKRKKEGLKTERGKYRWLSWTQSSLKLTTVHAVSEDSHRGVPVLLGRLMEETHRDRGGGGHIADMLTCRPSLSIIRQISHIFGTTQLSPVFGGTLLDNVVFASPACTQACRKDGLTPSQWQRQSEDL